MSDIFQEVEEDLRRERFKRAWDRYGIYLLVIAVLIVVVTAGWRGYEYWRMTQERAAGEAFVSVLDAVQETGTVTSAEALVEYADSAPGGYAMLAKFRAATAYADLEDPDRAVTLLEEIVSDRDVPALYRDLARIRVAQIHLDQNDPDAAKAAIGPIAQDTGNAYSRTAQELMGLAAYMQDDVGEARRWFSGLRDGAGTPQALQQRARLMLALITQTAPEEQSSTESAAQETN
ncbi:tetratricopeptide repeat protein [Acuticoccus sp. M5D2P5]|uniref:tetratricopeptide repeat protein n=1 Tax=Acuticoccus kalidii TaxID=2910977 RepID=UPI001F1D73D4|nr:tetratricopeptide repeat protein [Acuticoccus kalidii]MCF3935729.1 tetratricopeptide repeat protein [Acuticoccus kalidii]